MKDKNPDSSSDEDESNFCVRVLHGFDTTPKRRCSKVGPLAPYQEPIYPEKLKRSNDKMRNSDKLISDFNKRRDGESVEKLKGYGSDEGFDEKCSHTSSESTCGDSEKRKKKSLKEYTKQQWGALGVICYINFASNTSMSMLSAFFGGEAVEHGATQLQIGLIFGCYAIINAMACPILGYFLPYIGAKSMLIVGLLVSSVCSFAFSQLYRIEVSGWFIGGCFAIRAVQALGCSLYYIGATVIVAREWSDNLTFAFGMGEIFTGLGMIAGPMIGGMLYQLGGFQLPFLVIGGLMFLGLSIAQMLVRPYPATTVPGNFLTLIKIPNVAATSVFMCFMWAAMDFNMPQLELHMTDLDASPVLVGTMFMILAVGYSILAPLVGLFVHTTTAERSTMIMGGVLVAISYLLIGPSPLLRFTGLHEPTLLTIGISMAVLGLGLGAALVPTFNDLNKSAVAGGLPDDDTTAGLVGGLFNGVIFFGEFIGPTIGGAMMEHYDNYPLVSSTFAAILFCVVFSVAIFYMVDGRKKRNHENLI